jgi:hypothetical protein
MLAVYAQWSFLVKETSYNALDKTIHLDVSSRSEREEMWRFHNSDNVSGVVQGRFSRRFHIAATGVRVRFGHVGFVVDSATLQQVSIKTSGSPAKCSTSCSTCITKHLYQGL